MENTRACFKKLINTETESFKYIVKAPSKICSEQ